MLYEDKLGTHTLAVSKKNFLAQQCGQPTISELVQRLSDDWGQGGQGWDLQVLQGYR